MAAEFATPWPDFIPGAGGESYKELSAQLPNRQGLKQADCSFWSKYIQTLKDAGSSALGTRIWEWCWIQNLLISFVLAYTVYMEATRALGTRGIAPFHEMLTVQGFFAAKSLLL